MKVEQLLRDPDIPPNDEVIAKGLGPAYNAYAKFTERLKKHNIKVDWRYYNDGKAWLGKALYVWTNTKGTQKEMTAFWLSVWNGSFKVSLFIPKKAAADASELSRSDEIKKMIEDTKELGKLKFFTLVFDLRSDELFNEIFALIDLAVRSKRP